MIFNRHYQHLISSLLYAEHAKLHIFHRYSNLLPDLQNLVSLTLMRHIKISKEVTYQ